MLKIGIQQIMSEVQTNYFKLIFRTYGFKPDV